MTQNAFGAAKVLGERRPVVRLRGSKAVVLGRSAPARLDEFSNHGIEQPVTGTYTLRVDPTGTYVGTGTLTLHDVPPDLALEMSPGGPSARLTIGTPGQNARVTFQGVAGRRLSVQVTAMTVQATYFSITAPDGSTLVPTTLMTASGGFIDTRLLPATGTYTMLVDPSGAFTGQMTITLWDVPADNTGVTAPGGSPVTVAMTTPGQNAHVTFEGVAGRRISLRVNPSTVNAVSFTIVAPGGATVVRSTLLTGAGFIDTRTLPETGTYAIHIDPWNSNTGQMTLTLYDVVDATGALEINGRTKTVTLGTPGQNALLTFAGLDGDTVIVRITGSTVSATDAELENIASLYEPGQSLWRTRITHFSPWDLNWPYYPPEDAKESDAPEADGEDEKTGEQEDCQGGASTIGCQSATLNEAIAVVGTPFGLHYRSSRTPGRRGGYRLDIPVSGASVPAILKRIDLTVSVGGQIIRQSLGAAPGQRVPFTWNGQDVYGRAIQGTTPAVISIGYVYDAPYATPAEGDRSFGQPGTGAITGDDVRQELTLWRSYTRTMGAWDATAGGLGGWTLDVNHSYDPGSRTLYLGDGTERSASKVEWRVMDTVAGGGSVAGSAGNGLPARQAAIRPEGLRAGPDGSLYFSDAGNVRRVDSSGVLSTVVTAVPGDVSAIGPDGSIYLVDSANDQVRRIRPGGLAEVIAGDGTWGYGGDGGPATSARLAAPSGVAVAPDGTVYIADTQNYRIRRVTPDGTITTFAGTGDYGFGGDDGPATAALLDEPFNVALGPDGSVYIADFWNNRVRRVTPDGTIRTAIGSGAWGFDGDGGAVGGPFSATVIFDTSGNPIGFTVGYGPGIPVGASGSYSMTGVLTLKDVWEFMKNLWRSVGCAGKS